MRRKLAQLPLAAVPQSHLFFVTLLTIRYKLHFLTDRLIIVPIIHPFTFGRIFHPVPRMTDSVRVLHLSTSGAPCPRADGGWWTISGIITRPLANRRSGPPSPSSGITLLFSRGESQISGIPRFLNNLLFIPSSSTKRNGKSEQAPTWMCQ